ncbi:MAG TPA: CBS domain-containing protein [Candidatus Aminicenantes bacterium]|nr:CBS domain-containing protein [Candidatus Aminicenantes bacterium]HRY64664.1 CBS domain-containing protein [Candidatus Aminicenantes bacterium]HRZ71577.1 CBS domain-containing protein [Candidatus Aminicenantes bacterium]
MITVKDILDQKGHAAWTIGPGAKVYEALELMAREELGALIVVEKDEIVGIISERDYARKIILMGRQSQDTPVREIMTKEVYGVRYETTADECMALMTDKRIRHLPVCREGRLAGVVSIGDVVKAVMTDQQVKIENLENYIMGKYQ